MAKANVNIGALGAIGEFVGSRQFVDVGQQTKTAQVVRDGIQVPQVVIDRTKAVFAIDNLVTVQPRAMPRVVSQSIAPGTRVPPGTVVDFVVVPKTDIPFTIFEGVHESLTTKTLDQVDALVENADVRQVLLKHESAAAVTPAEKTTLVAAFQSKGIVIDEAQPGKTFEKAFNSIRGAAAFR